MAIAASCVAVFLWTSLSEPARPSADTLENLDAWVEEHPWVQREYGGEKPDEATVRRDVHALRRMLDGFGGPERRLSLVPERGFAQVGWLTGLFVHFDLFHLLGNLLFLWIVGPLLEEAWGRARFSVFYLLAGLVASAVQFVLNRHEFVAIGGASGAIAGCMGAFAVRFAAERVRFHYFIWVVRIFTGEVWVPAWLCGLAWFGSEVWDLVSGSAPGVATGAHLGGFVLGSVVAFAMRGLFEGELLTGAESRDEQAARDRAFIEAQAALANGDFERARALASALQQRAPAHEGLLPLLAEADLRGGRGQARLERLLRELMTRDDGEVELLVARLKDVIDPHGFSPSLAWSLAERLRGKRASPQLAQGLLEAVAAGAGAQALKARALLAPPEPELREVRLLDARVASVQPLGLTLEVGGEEKNVSFDAIGVVHAGTVGRELVVDLVLRRPLVVLRLKGDDARVLAMFPGQSPVNAWQSFLAGLRRAARTGEAGAPWSAYASMEAFTSARPSA